MLLCIYVAENVSCNDCNKRQQYCSGIFTTIKEYGIIQHMYVPLLKTMKIVI